MAQTQAPAPAQLVSSEELRELAADMRAAMKALKVDEAVMEAAAWHCLQGWRLWKLLSSGKGGVVTTATELNVGWMENGGGGDNEGVALNAFHGDATGKFTAGVNLLTGTLHTNDFDRLYSNTHRFIFIPTPTNFCVLFFQDDWTLLGFIKNGCFIPTVHQFGSGLGHWNRLNFPFPWNPWKPQG